MRSLYNILKNIKEPKFGTLNKKEKKFILSKLKPNK